MSSKVTYLFYNGCIKVGLWAIGNHPIARETDDSGEIRKIIASMKSFVSLGEIC